MSEIDKPHSEIKVLFKRAEKEWIKGTSNPISQNSIKNVYEFAADYLSSKDNNKYTEKLKEIFKIR